MFGKKKGTFSMKKNTIATPNKNKERVLGRPSSSGASVLGVAYK
jgi:hypothetical protein